MKLTLISLLFCVILTACSQAPTAQEKQSFNEEINKLKLPEIKSFGASKTKRIPLKAGQWVTIMTQMKDDTKGINLSTFKVIKVVGKTVTIEVESFNANSAKNIMQYEVENYPMYDMLSVTKNELEKYLENIKIKRVVTKYGDRAPTEIPLEVINMSKGHVKSLFLTGYRIGEPHKEDCSSDNIKAKKCIIYNFEANVMGQAMSGKSYAHSDIPIVSFIKSDSDRAFTQVINYGLSGAKTSL